MQVTRTVKAKHQGGEACWGRPAAGHGKSTKWCDHRVLGDIKRPQTCWLEWLFEAWWRPGNMTTMMESTQQLMQGIPWVLGMLNGKELWDFITHCGDVIKGQSSQGRGCLFPPLLKILTLVRSYTIKIIPLPCHNAWSFYNFLWAVFYP